MITDDLVKNVLKEIKKNTVFKDADIFCEIQDDYNLIFLSIPIDDRSNFDDVTQFKLVTHLLDRIIPKRKNDYSWMVSFTKKGSIFEGYFGGNLSSPNSGV